MVRRGQNPAKFVDGVGKAERITLALITYAPFLGGYYSQTLQVLEACLQSIRATTKVPYDLLVFDNGSCAEVQSYLMKGKSSGWIQYLFLSEKNLGKGGAWNLIFSAAPGEIIAYSDSDVIFFEGWLERSLEILETFPKVGMVTARPFRTPPSLASHTIAWGERTEGVTFRRGQLILREVLAEMDLGLGQSEEEVRRRYERSEDILLTLSGVSAFVGASHWQFSAPKEVLKSLLPFQVEAPMGNVRQLDRAVNEAGYLRLMVTDPLVRHVGNCLTGWERRRSGARRRRLRDLPLLRRGLLYVHDRIFRLYH
jgi:glycosyltransferase involved in cell wall biosynthesis